MNLTDKIIGLLAPHECLVCQNEGGLLCDPCAERLTRVPARCYRCHKLRPEALTCRTCRSAGGLYRVNVSTIYAGAAKQLIWRLKFAGAQDAAATVASLLTLYGSDPNRLLVPVPTATGRVRRRGYDQAKLIARETAKLYHQPYLDCLVRLGQTQQVGASRRQRLRQLEGSFRVKNWAGIAGAHVLLVDDVITTGATLEAAGRALKAAGARRVEALVLAQA